MVNGRLLDSIELSKAKNNGIFQISKPSIQLPIVITGIGDGLKVLMSY